ncbi:MAG: response regulator [Oscillospiraceae bacterium]|nr:response regulator [Oscillospiraceae bacterium]
MTDREKLLKISNLTLNGVIGQMDEEQMGQYLEILQGFTGSFPKQEEKLKAELSAGDNTGCGQSLHALQETLGSIHADVLAQECGRLADGLADTPHEKNVAYITNLLAAVSALSIDVQMALHKNEKDAEQAAKPKNTPEVKAGSILAVDDVALFLSTLRSYLKGTPCKLTCVTSGWDALRFIRHHTPDLFLLDIDMPDMDGYELARKIRESGQKAPIIFLTGNAAINYVMKAIEVGAADFIVKPLKKDQLFEKISKYVNLEKPSTEDGED